MTGVERIRTVVHMSLIRSLRRGAGLALVSLVVLACSSTATTVVEPTVSIPPRTSSSTVAEDPAPVGEADPALAAAFDELVTTVDGGAVAAVRVADGPLQILAAGTDPDGIPVKADDVVRVGSISKVFTSVLVLTFVEDGELDLDARLDSILTETPVGGDVTIRQLLSHRSGIPNYTENAGFFSAVLQRPSRAVSPDDVLGFVDDSDPLFDPGDRYSYSNTNFVLLGQVIETLAGATLNEVLSERITAPLGLTRTSFDVGDRTDVLGGVTAVSASGTASFDYTSVASSAWAAGSLVTTAEELAVFATALFDGALLDEELVVAMRQPIDDGAEYGLGLHEGSDFGIGHGGAILGFNSMLQLDPATGDLLLVVVNNEQRRPAALTEAVWEAAGGT